MNRLTLRAACACALLFFASTTARADEPEDSGPRLPLVYTERPLALPPLVLRPVLEGDVVRDSGTFVSASVGAAFGILDHWQVQAVVAPLQLSPSVTYGSLHDRVGPSIGTLYRVSRGTPTEAAIAIDAVAFTAPGTTGAIVTPGIPFRAHGGTAVRIDWGIFVPVTTSHTTTAGLDLPFAIAFQGSEAVHVGVSSGITLDSFGNPGTIAIPLGLFAGYAIFGKDGPIVEIDPFFRWPKLLSEDTWPPAWHAGLDLVAFLYL